MSFLGKDQEVDGTRRAMTIIGAMIGEFGRFKYLGSFVQRQGLFDRCIT